MYFDFDHLRFSLPHSPFETYTYIYILVSLRMKYREISRIEHHYFLWNIVVHCSWFDQLFDVEDQFDRLSFDRNIYNNQIKCIFDSTVIKINVETICEYFNNYHYFDSLQYFIYTNVSLFFFWSFSQFTLEGKIIFIHIYIYI